MDGDYAHWTGGIHALLGEKPDALAWLRRAVEVGDHNYPGFQEGQELRQLTR
jgi:serine/threonine-protein kinase